jgi:hypothetical protein
MDGLPALLQARGLKAVEELIACNNFTVRFGLYLSEEQAQSLMGKRMEALRDTGRVEFGEGILKKLIFEFCDSPYIMQDNYVDTLLALQDAFYYFKNESLEQLSDDELIAFMKRHFDGDCEGSLEYLSSSSLEDLCRGVRYGQAWGEDEDDR